MNHYKTSVLGKETVGPMGSAALTGRHHHVHSSQQEAAGRHRELSPVPSDGLGGHEGRLRKEGLHVYMLSVHTHTRLMHVLVQRKPI